MGIVVSPMVDEVEQARNEWGPRSDDQLETQGNQDRAGIR